MKCKACAHEGAACPTPALQAMMETQGDWPCAFGRRRTKQETAQRIETLWEAANWQQPHQAE